MSRIEQMQTLLAAYIPASDALDRHEYGITKQRKVASTGGGRAWSEDEEAYLLQTRLQKMPYKHIAAHLKKTELACRLHFHQLSHGSNRRKRTTSVSSASSTGGRSPTILTSIPSPIQEDDTMAGLSRSNSPANSACSYSSTSAASPHRVQLPRIITGPLTISPRLPAILPKPASVTATLASATHSAPLATPAPYRGPVAPASAAPRLGLPHHHPGLPGPLRLDCSGLPPPPSSAGFSSTPSTATYSALTYSTTNSHPVDMSRLASVYAAHRASFWATVAADYGNGANPLVLEQAWKGTGSSTGSMGPPGSQMTPITPCGSPDDHLYGKHDKTRISAILGIDANPRSPQEREMVKRIEEERVGA